MQRKKTLQIGSSDFKSFIESDGYFVDKTLLIQEIIDTHYQVLLIPRPRRFGKSINLSMLKYYFDAGAQDNATLFEPFKIWKAETYYTSKQGKHPVIHISLKGGKAATFEKSQAHIFNILTEVYRDFRWLLEKDILDEDEQTEYLSITAGGVASPALYATSLKKLSKYLGLYYGEKVLILMDEYDAPIHTGFYHGYYNQIIELMKSLMGSTFKDNDALYKGVITGILRIAKESIFSDLNNPGIFTILSPTFADKFGFTKEEVQDLLTYYDLAQDFEQVEQWYDGYTFGHTNHIYNPWSITNYIARHTEGFKTWWVNTSSDDLIKSRIIEKSAADIRSNIEQLLLGNTIQQRIDENIIFTDFTEDKELLWSLLTFCGYLSPVKAIKQKDYALKIPNFEIQELFREIIIEWFKKGLKVRQTTLRAMSKSLMENRIPDFKRYFKKIMADTFSYFDVNTEPERVYQAYVLGLLGIMGDEYVIKSNRESWHGRYDILLLPRNNNDYGIIIEIKQLKKDASPARIQVELADALKQITSNKYYKELVAHKVQNRIEMAMVFAGKEVYLDTK